MEPYLQSMEPYLQSMEPYLQLVEPYLQLVEPYLQLVEQQHLLCLHLLCLKQQLQFDFLHILLQESKDL